MRLLYIHTNKINSEDANIIQVFNMCNAFNKIGLNVTLAIPESQNIDQTNFSKYCKSKYGEENYFSIKFYKKYDLFGHLKTFGSYFGVCRILDDTNADICYVRNSFLIKIIIKKGLPVIFESHNILLHRASKILDYFMKKRLYKNIKNKKFVMTITISEALKNAWIKRGIPEDKIFSYHDGFNPIIFNNSANTKKPKVFSNNKKNVIYAGSLYKNRGIERILKLARILKEANFIIVGGPNIRVQAIKYRCRELNIHNVRLVGRVDPSEIPIYLLNSDVLLMIWSNKVPTINYCSPLKVFECMAAGKIIVSHGFQTIKEVLTDGENAFLVPPDSFENLLDKTKEAIQISYPCTMAENARTLAYEKYTWEKRASAIIKVLKNKII